MVETEILMHPRSPDKNSSSEQFLQHSGTGENKKCNHLGYIVINTLSEYSVFAVQF